MDHVCNIFLIGFMGSGKSTIAACLSKKLGLKTVEMDQQIAEQENRSISDIFSLHGEEYFRRLETQLLSDLKREEPVIVSCGGGVPMRAENVAKMKERGKIVLLKASPKTILERIQDDHSRPLLEGHKDVAYISGLMEQRRKKYEAAADVSVITDGKEKNQICEEIILKILGKTEKKGD